MNNYDCFETEFFNLCKKYDVRAVFVIAEPREHDCVLISGGDSALCELVDEKFIDNSKKP